MIKDNFSSVCLLKKSLTLPLHLLMMLIWADDYMFRHASHITFRITLLLRSAAAHVLESNTFLDAFNLTAMRYFRPTGDNFPNTTKHLCKWHANRDKGGVLDCLARYFESQESDAPLRNCTSAMGASKFDCLLMLIWFVRKRVHECRADIIIYWLLRDRSERWNRIISEGDTQTTTRNIGIHWNESI